MTTLYTDRGDQVQSPADYASAIHRRRRPSHWPAALWLLALMWIFVGLFLLAGCSAPSAQQEAEATAASVQDAETAALQAHVDAACGHLAGRAGMQCALDELQRIQPERWIPEDAARAALAVPYAINEE